MAPTRVMTVFGTRPEAIKLAPVIHQLEKDNRFKSIVVVTAQHREMLDQVLNLFTIHPDCDLNLMRDDQDLASLSASIFRNLDPITAASRSGMSKQGYAQEINGSLSPKKSTDG